ncbi:MAG: hypothetical protein ABIH59_00205 [archaeon]
MEKTKLLKDLEEKFKKSKTEIGFSPDLEDIDRIFFIKDAILKEGFISERFSRQLCYRIVENYMGWNDYLHSIIMPNPQNILNMSESKIFSQEEKKEIVELMKKLMSISSRNSLIGLTKDQKAEKEFIDYSVDFWEKEFKEKITKIMAKVNKEWERPQ